MRLFVASVPGPAFAGNLKAIADYARDKAGRDAVKWVEPANFHLTYAFLGELDEAGAAAAAKGLRAGLAGVKAFRIVSGGFGVFPSQRRPSVLWVGIGEGAAELRETARLAAEGLKGAGLKFEERFEPHITIGRVKRPLPPEFFRRVSDYAAARKAEASIEAVELMESRLTQDGPVYRSVWTGRLG